MKFYKTALKYGASLFAFAAIGGVSGAAFATSLIPAGTLTTVGTDLTDTFNEGISWAYPIMLVFTGGVVAFVMVRRLIKMGAKA